ncbi:hypothetical protein ACSQ67_019900 [Phaseolus vulgaris]
MQRGMELAGLRSALCSFFKSCKRNMWPCEEEERPNFRAKICLEAMISLAKQRRHALLGLCSAFVCSRFLRLVRVLSGRSLFDSVSIRFYCDNDILPFSCLLSLVSSSTSSSVWCIFHGILVGDGTCVFRKNMAKEYGVKVDEVNIVWDWDLSKEEKTLDIVFEARHFGGESSPKCSENNESSFTSIDLESVLSEQRRVSTKDRGKWHLH